MAQFIPTTSAEFEYLTTVTTWGDRDEIDVNLNVDKHKDGTETILKSPDWIKSNNFITRDFRLGNLNNRVDDIQYLEDRARLVNVLLVLRPGKFDKQAAVALSQVAAPLELSQSRGGFFRRTAKTVTQESSVKEEQITAGFFGRKKNRGY